MAATVSIAFAGLLHTMVYLPIYTNPALQQGQVWKRCNVSSDPFVKQDCSMYEVMAVKEGHVLYIKDKYNTGSAKARHFLGGNMELVE